MELTYSYSTSQSRAVSDVTRIDLCSLLAIPSSALDLSSSSSNGPWKLPDYFLLYIIWKDCPFITRY